MEYLGVTQRTAQWLLEKPEICAALFQALQDGSRDILKAYDFAQGPVRASVDPSGRLVMFWNIDYLTTYGDDDLGFIRLTEPFGIFSCGHSIQKSTREKEVHVVNQRLLNRLFPSSDFYRKLDNGGAKIAAPRADDGTDLNFGFYESPYSLERITIKTILCFGPEHDFDEISSTAVEHRSDLDFLVPEAIALLRSKSRKPLAGSGAFATLRSAIDPVAHENLERLLAVTERTARPELSPADVYRSLSWSYDDWVAPQSTLSFDQRELLESDHILHRPVRIVGPAGSGKTLLMQLLVMRRLRDSNSNTRVLYVTHNEKMAQSVQERFVVLGADEYFANARLSVSTLARYANGILKIQVHRLFDADAARAKDEQLHMIRQTITPILAKYQDIISASETLSALTRDEQAFEQFYDLLRADYSVAIKARDLSSNRDGYVTSANPLGPLHALLKPEERALVYDAFQAYQLSLEVYDILDADDVALTMLGELRTPKWRLDRRKLGFDYVFVDEAQLFNENERRIFALLTKTATPYTPVALALDEAQQMYVQKTTGMALLGIEDVERTRLRIAHRLAPGIARLAFYVISQSVDLFHDDFPDFTKDLLEEQKAILEVPTLSCPSEESTVSALVLSTLKAYRRADLTRILVVCHAEKYWEELARELSRQNETDLLILKERGERAPGAGAITVLSRPEIIGGQEYDAVICVGLEEGVVPPRIAGNQQLEDLFEQNALREIYLAFTRARFRLCVILGRSQRPTAILERAISNGFIEDNCADARQGRLI